MSFIKKIQSKLSKNDEDENKLITFINPFSYLELRKSNVIDRIDKIYVDGILLVIMFKIIGINIQRKSFDMTSLAPVVFKKCGDEGKQIYFIGSKTSEINKFIKIIKKEYQNLNIIGHRNGFFKSIDDENETIDEIITLNPDIIIAGLGTPKQEIFLIKLRKLGWKGTGYTCGGFIHQTSKGIKYYPIIFDKLNLRWLYRFLDERRVFFRTIKTYPIFMVVFFRDYFRKN
ncbi:WecB/TagA/CpsF family glycosyltransferase [Aquimarina intermedia]|uniref:N-acetylglucosaminyldiphosphoundecaprenol N-acetyl-beta-D-mannosaminyltransferase n=1 Tax=Aquimarina intermedia TaxID=350814 RepID=A0A5S5CCI2_9FLAO|nr:WecB/TagA/CpsF family glycosyltransferase [Aquimarina intermedia]TYP76869.1 N-acetylglucosaminyldiphosphoundecaprenol N-acetyl-beta-D-mannosaminyltransferase [Aquimarina intermedia]